MSVPTSRPSLLVEQKRIEALLKNKYSANYWEERKMAHEEVQKGLEHYAGKLQENIMVPIGKKGLMRGRIVNTNQVFVSLGGGWFTKVCSAEAQKVCTRRITECTEMLQKLENERKILEGWTAIHDKQVFANEGTKEIIELYNEEEEASWREKHAEKAKEHKKKLAGIRQQLDENREKDKKTEEDLWRHLDLLELQEEFEDELDRLGENSESESESVVSSSLDSDDYSSQDEINVNYEKTSEENLAANSNKTYTEKEKCSLIEEIIPPIVKSNNAVGGSFENKTKIKKKVSFDESTFSTEIEKNQNVTRAEIEKVSAFGEVVEHKLDLSVHHSDPQENRPISKFKSSKMKKKN